MKRKIKIIVVIAIILALAMWFILLAINPEPHFKITKEGIEVDEINLCDFKSCEDNHPVIISRQDLTKQWLEENCELSDSDNKYKCGDYFVEVWDQIK